MKYTLLQLVQTILASMESDAVNSINDTDEATTVATIVRTSYYDLVTRLKLPEHNDMFSLIAAKDVTKPTLMYLPDDVENLFWVRYDKTPLNSAKTYIGKVSFLPLDEFMDVTYTYASSQDATLAYTVPRGSSTLTVYCGSDKPPSYYTTFDNSTVLFDAYDSAVDTMLQGSKTTCHGKKQFTFPLLDSFVPALDEQQFQLLLNEAKGTAWVELKQMPHPRAEKKVKQHLIASQYNKDAIGDTQSRFKANLPNYGRARAYKPKLFRPID